VSGIDMLFADAALAETDRPWNFEDLYFQHAQRCWQVAQMASPPGIDPELWAVHLLDKTPQQIEDRLRRLAMHKGVPTAFERVPTKMVAGVKQGLRRVVAEYAQQFVQKDIDLLVKQRGNGDRDAGLLRTAQTRARNTLRAFEQTLEQRVSLKVKLKMQRNGSIVVEVE